jgi:hypothetical protein
MHYRLDPHIFVGQPMTLRRIADDDYRATIGGHTAGRIFRKMRGGNQYVWLWTVTGPSCAGAGLNSSGDCEELAEAKVAFRATFDSWLSWAMKQKTVATWYE